MEMKHKSPMPASLTAVQPSCLGHTFSITRFLVTCLHAHAVCILWEHQVFSWAPVQTIPLDTKMHLTHLSTESLILIMKDESQVFLNQAKPSQVGAANQNGKSTALVDICLF